jgi:hypothetical protein
LSLGPWALSYGKETKERQEAKVESKEWKANIKLEYNNNEYRK